jgi:hypothetical protein
MPAWIQEDTEQDYSQREYGKNLLVVGDGSDGENEFSTTNTENTAPQRRLLPFDVHLSTADPLLFGHIRHYSAIFWYYTK